MVAAAVVVVVVVTCPAQQKPQHRSALAIAIARAFATRADVDMSTTKPHRVAIYTYFGGDRQSLPVGRLGQREHASRAAVVIRCVFVCAVESRSVAIPVVSRRAHFTWPLTTHTRVALRDEGLYIRARNVYIHCPHVRAAAFPRGGGGEHFAWAMMGAECQ